MLAPVCLTRMNRRRQHAHGVTSRTSGTHTHTKGTARVLATVGKRTIDTRQCMFGVSTLRLT